MRRSARLLNTATLIACALILSPCARRETSFRHDGHVTVTKGDCSPCHGDDPANPRPATTADCAACHRQSADPAKAGKYGVDPGQSTRPPRGFVNVIFSHASHAGAGVACAFCHGKKGSPAFPSMKECTRCHEEEGVPTICKECHRKVPSDTGRERTPAR
jgi:hypothetical protein